MKVNLKNKRKIAKLPKRHKPTRHTAAFMLSQISQKWISKVKSDWQEIENKEECRISANPKTVLKPQDALSMVSLDFYTHPVATVISERAKST